MPVIVEAISPTNRTAVRPKTCTRTLRSRNQRRVAALPPLVGGCWAAVLIVFFSPDDDAARFRRRYVVRGRIVSHGKEFS
jgi:hypothetical protein